MKKLLKILLIIPVLYLLAMPVYYAVSSSTKTCSGIVVSITDSADYHFVTKRQLLNLAYGRSGKIIGQPLNKVSEYEIENRINILRELKVAEVYTTIDGALHLYVDQRNPVMRIIPDEGGDYFLDEEGFLFRKRNLYNPRLHIVEGNINITPAMLDSVSILDTLIRHTILKDVFHFVNYIRDDNFWSAQIDQIYIDSRDEVNLVPRVGSHLIHLGTFENYEGKLRNLEAFYDKVLPVVGWDKYSTINLEYKDQLVCKKKQQ
jgi:cell division protein FtsQ